MTQPWKPLTDLAALKVLGKLGEELGEAQSASSRCIIQGLDGINPHGGKVNRQWLMEELADVMATVQLTTLHFRMDGDEFWTRVEKKVARMAEWLAMEAVDEHR